MAAIPNPELGLVRNYAFLWSDEHREGLEEGRKNRPSAIAFRTAQRNDGATTVIVLPITHAPPRAPTVAIASSPSVKQHLGLDDDPSWIILTDGKEFVWPGFDLRKAPGKDAYAFGFPPPRLFACIRDAFTALRAGGKTKTATRN